ncbi:integrase [Desulfosarcina ovata subsp. sediminis]|uniref:Integrase n=1 Tax=Desulfosarcina ovata subsp. sediminis TaxID=885957 RepID=A0A5K7ZH66_9BACT|nr:hypothetical protein [Desulfosarcina ovata]BBO80201.1 integrase [Desulfosarcina ovata subsp. sediminis]
MDWKHELARRLSTAVNGEKDRIIAEYQSMTGKSPATLYRIAKKHGFSSGRKKRCDAMTCELNEEQIQFVSTLIQTSAREVKGTIMGVEDALEIAIDNGVIRPGQISVSRMQAILREREMNAKSIDSVDPSIRMASLHPNHVHVFDASICIQYYLRGRRGFGFLDERDFREKKPKNFEKIKRRIYRMVLADHFSHNLFVKYYLATGENAAMTMDFLTAAWRGGHDVGLPMHGVTFLLLMDAGAANVAKGIMNWLSALGVKVPPNAVHNPKRQGSAENAQNIVERKFESKLRFEPATTVEDLNKWVIDWLVKFNGEHKHKRHRMTRTACWLKYARQEHIRVLPSDEILHMLYAEPEIEATVNQDNTVQFKKEFYWLKHIEGISPGKKVKVIVRPYHWPTVGIAFDGQEYTVEPVGFRDGGFLANAQVIGEGYQRQPDTNIQKIRKANENLAYGDERKKNDLPFGGSLVVHGNQAEKVKSVPMPRQGNAIEIDTSVFAEQKVSIMAFMTAIKRAGADISPDLNRAIREAYGSAIDVLEKERLLAIVRSNGAITIDDLGGNHAGAEAIAV